MKNYTVNGIAPFLPARNFGLSKQFYQALGFTQQADIGNAILYTSNGVGFWLQDYYVDALAENLMLCLYVSDVGIWWANSRAVFAQQVYSDARVLSEPHDQDGAVMMQFCDLSGVLWHVRQG